MNRLLMTRWEVCCPRSHLLLPPPLPQIPLRLRRKSQWIMGSPVPPSLVISSESDAEKEKDRISKIPVDGEDPFFSIANGELRYSLGMGGIEISDSMPPTPTQPQVAHIQPSASGIGYDEVERRCGRYHPTRT